MGHSNGGSAGTGKHMTRSEAITTFLSGTDWAEAKRKPLAGDASNRRYERLHLSDRTAVLMDAPPARGEDVRPFLRVARHLASLGFSTPEVLAEDADQGFLLLEDFSDALIAKLLEDTPEEAAALYGTAVDVLIELHQHAPLEGVEAFTPDVMTTLVAPLWDWYVGHGQDRNHLQDEFSTLFQPILAEYADDQSVLILRDFHAENLIHLPQRTGIRQMGLLDFQDAKAGHPAYDLVSLLQDARRDVPEALERDMIARYLTQSQQDPARFTAAYSVLGLQRNLRILGVLTRLCLHAGKTRYVDFLPRVWGYVQRDLAHPALATVRPMLSDLPATTPEFCQDLKDRAVTCPDL